MHGLVTTLLDVLGLLLLAAGAGAGVAVWAGWAAGLAVAGVVVLAGSQLAVALASRQQRGGDHL